MLLNDNTSQPLCNDCTGENMCAKFRTMKNWVIPLLSLLNLKDLRLRRQEILNVQLEL